MTCLSIPCSPGILASRCGGRADWPRRLARRARRLGARGPDLLRGAGFLAVDARALAAHSSGVTAADRDDITACLNGDGEAYERLVRRYQGEVASRMRRFTRDPARLEDLVQEVFVEAYFSLATYRGAAPFAHWLSRIATRAGCRFWQAEKRRTRLAALSLADWDALADQPVEPNRAAELLEEVMGRLGPRDRLVLTLMYLEGRSVAETADLAGWSRTMVKVQAHRARKRLKALLDRRPTEET